MIPKTPLVHNQKGWHKVEAKLDLSQSSGMLTDERVGISR